MKQEVPGPCACCGEWIEDGDFFARDAEGRLFCLSCYDATEPKPVPASKSMERRIKLQKENP